MNHPSPRCETSESLQVALSASRPIATARDPLPVEMLVSEHTRRCMATDDQGRDMIDHPAADPVVDRIAHRRPKHKVNRINRILDDLDRNHNRRCKP